MKKYIAFIIVCIISVMGCGRVVYSQTVEKTDQIYKKRYEINDRIIRSQFFKTGEDDIKKEFIDDEVGQVSLFYLENKSKDKYEIAISEKNGDFKFVSSAKSYDEGISKLKSAKAKSDEIKCLINENGKIIYADKALGRIVKYINGQVDNTRNNITNIYEDSNLKNAFTYVNHGYIDDVPIIEDKGNVAKIKVAGYKGWVNKNVNSKDYDLVIVPLNQATNPSYYYVQGGILKHFISSNLVSKKKEGYSIELGKAPNFLKENKNYYSYDGLYFYDSLEKLINDEKNNTNKLSLNYNSPYYSYFQNLSFRSKTSYTVTELNRFISENTKSESKLRGTGQAFINAQNKYGVNAALMLGVAINESGYGMSKISQEKNNIFGINAVDSKPGQAANKFSTVADCINEFAKNYISSGYADIKDWRYFGAVLGNKTLGANVKYASDPYWGEKGSQFAFKIDYYLSGKSLSKLRDNDFYQLAIPTTQNKVTDRSGNLIYKVLNQSISSEGDIGAPIIINSKELITIGGKKEWLEINPDVNANVSKDGIYEWNSKGFINKNGIKYINTSKKKSNPEIKYQSHVQSIGWQNFAKNGELSGTVGKSKRLEAFKIQLENRPDNVALSYRSFVEGESWNSWKNEGQISGTTGKGKRIEAIQINITGTDAYMYDVEYRVHVQGKGWMPWVKNGVTSGLANSGKRIEAMEVKLVRNKVKPKAIDVSYKVHGETYGWKSSVSNGVYAGTIGEGKRLEAIKLEASSRLGLKYRVHVQGKGWLDWKSSGEIAGTIGERRRIEAIEIKLTGQDKDKYSVQYRVQGERYGWQDWKKDSETSGTVGESKRVEGIEIVISNK